jgi:hypothetical protein
MVPAVQALMSLLTLKLLDKERRSHIDDFNCDEALGLFAGLNILPKKSFVTDYSYRTQRRHQEKLLKHWIAGLRPLLFPEADSFSLDFHPIPYRGEEAVLEQHFQPRRGRAGSSVQTFFAQERTSQVLCYANANLTRDKQDDAVWEFARFWRGLTGRYPQWLYFDSKLTSYKKLTQLSKKDIWFVTIRRRGSNGDELCPPQRNRGRVRNRRQLLPPGLSFQRGASECGSGYGADGHRQRLLPLAGDSSKRLRERPSGLRVAV